MNQRPLLIAVALLIITPTTSFAEPAVQLYRVAKKNLRCNEEIRLICPQMRKREKLNCVYEHIDDFSLGCQVKLKPDLKEAGIGAAKQTPPPLPTPRRRVRQPKQGLARF